MNKNIKMACNTKIRISSHNVRGFADSKDFLQSRCKSDANLIQCVQEHWLPPPFKKRAGTNAMRSVHPDFEGFAVSAMKNAEQDGIRRGRGFGGTGFIFPKHLSRVLKPLVKFNHDRVSVMELIQSDSTLIIINVYMPYLNRSDLQNTISKYDEVIGYIEYVMGEFVNAHFVIVGDFNCNIYDPTHPFVPSLSDFLQSHCLYNTFSLMASFDASSSFTRSDSRSKSILDYVFVSEALLSRVSNVAIGEYHDNFSDHLPVEVDISLCLSDTGSRHTSHNSNNLNINWSKLQKENLDAYTSTMETALDLISFSPCILHGSFLCTDNCHKYHIEEYFNHIVNAIKMADSILERTNSRALKPYWSPQLTKLKQESFSTHRAWLQADKPSSGILHDDYIHARQNYRKCLHLEKRRSSEKANDKMLDGLLNKNSVGFWRTWNSINRVKDPLPARIDGHMDDSGISNHFADVFSGIYENRDIDSHDSLRSDFYSCFNEYYNEHLLTILVITISHGMTWWI